MGWGTSSTKERCSPASKDGSEQYRTDLRQSFVSVRVNGRFKRIEDYDGTPATLIAFEARIDTLTRSKRWTFLDGPMLASLRESGWTPSRQELARLIERAVWTDDLPIVQGLLDFAAGANRALLTAGANPAVEGGEGRSVLGLARAIQQSRTRPPDPDLRYRQDYAEVVALLERALAKR